MPSKRTLLGAAAFSVALAGGGVAGALLGTPTLSAAQDDTGTETTEAPAEAADHPGRPFGHRGERLSVAAEALGMTEDELKAELEAGKSIAQVAEEQGVDLQTVVDALVAEGTERLEAAIAALPERVDELVQREGLPERRFHRGPRSGDEAEDTAEDAAA